MVSLWIHFLTKLIRIGLKPCTNVTLLLSLPLCLSIFLCLFNFLSLSISLSLSLYPENGHYHHDNILIKPEIE